jgi:tetratricopeptide (TPR) repeat protein
MFRPHSLIAASMLGAWLALQAPLAVAETPMKLDAAVHDHTLKEARAQHRAGVEAFAEQRYEDAVEAFLSADAFHPSPETAFNIAKAYEAQGDLSHALSYYREYLRRAPHAQDRAAVSAHAEQLAKGLAQHGIQQVTFSADPAGATVLLDAEPVGTAPITLDIRPGLHHVEFRKSGRAPVSVQFDLLADRALDVVAKLPAEKAAAAAPEAVRDIASKSSSSNGAPRRSLSPEQVATARSSTSSVTRTIGFAALGAGVAALGGAVTLEVMRSSAEDEAREATDQVAFSEAIERMRTRQTLARVFAGAGGALAAIGGVMLVVASGNSSSGERPSKQGGLAFGCQPFKCHASYSQTF